METEPAPTDADVRTGVAARLHDVLRRLFGQEAPVRIRAWDGSEAGPTDAPVVVVRERRAVRRLLWRPDELGLARGLIAGEIETQGPLLDTLERLAPYARTIGARPELTVADRAELLRTAVELGAVGPQPKPPPEELVGRSRRTAIAQEDTSVEHVGADEHDGPPAAFAEAVLGPEYLCGPGLWPSTDGDDAATLAQAQLAGADLVGRRLGLDDGMRLLDMHCEWGGLVVRLAQRYDIEAIGVTRSAEQAEVAERLVTDAGLEKRVRILTGDWRDLDVGEFDAITGGGLGDFRPGEDFGALMQAVAARLRPGGRLLLDQAISRSREPLAPVRSFIDAYVTPRAALPRLGEIVDALELAGLEVRAVESRRDHQVRTLRAWAANLDARWDDLRQEIPEGRLRVWRLYLAVAVLALQSGRVGTHEVLAVRLPFGAQERAVGDSSTATIQDMRGEWGLPASRLAR